MSQQNFHCTLAFCKALNRRVLPLFQRALNLTVLNRSHLARHHGLCSCRAASQYEGMCRTVKCFAMWQGLINTMCIAWVNHLGASCQTDYFIEFLLFVTADNPACADGVCRVCATSDEDEPGHDVLAPGLRLPQHFLLQI